MDGNEERSKKTSMGSESHDHSKKDAERFLRAKEKATA